MISYAIFLDSVVNPSHHGCQQSAPPCPFLFVRPVHCTDALGLLRSLAPQTELNFRMPLSVTASETREPPFAHSTASLRGSLELGPTCSHVCFRIKLRV